MLKLFKKDLKLFFNDKRSVILTFLLPIILITLFAFAYSSIGSYNGRSEPVKLLVADLDNSFYSNEIISKIDSLKDISITTSDSLMSKEKVIRGTFAGALIIYKGFQDSLENGNATQIELVYDRSREMEIGILQQNLISTLMSSAGKIIVKKSIENYLQDQFPGINKIAIKWTSIVGEKNDTNLGLIQAVAGTAILMLLFSVAGVGTSLL